MARCRWALALCAAVVLLVVVPVAARGQSVLYAADGAGGGPSILYRLDARTGEQLQEIGPIGFDEVSGIAFDPVTGTLYGVSNGSGELITIDPETGAGTAVGPLGTGGKVPDLSFAPSGVLYGWTEAAGLDDLITLDLSTGTGTSVGDCGVSTSQTGLAIDMEGTAFMKRNTQLYAVDRVTGSCTLRATLPPSVLHNVLAFDNRGTLYTAARSAGGTTEIFSVDPETGAVTSVGTSRISTLSSLAFQPPPLAPLYATDGSGGNPATLYRLDPRDGSVLQTIGPTGFDHLTGLAFHPVTGVLYGVTRTDLVTIDLETGAGTVVGPHGLGSGASGLGVPDADFAPSGLLYAWHQAQEDLATIDPTSGVGAVVGDCGAFTALTGLAIDRRGNALMKAASNLYSVDRVTGACTLQVPLGALSGPLDNGLAHDHKGTLYSFERTSGAADLYTIDPITGDVTFVGSNGLANLSALAFQPPPLEPLFAVDGAGGNAATLYRLDPRDGSVLQTIGPVGFAHVVGLAFHPVTGVLYATSNDGGVGGTDQLLTLDPSTGAGTAVGAHTGQITDIAFAPSGVLYGWDEDSPTNDDLATIDLATGAQTTVGECGAGTSATGLGVDAEGNAWMKSSSGLYRVERATGACTLVTGLSQPLFPSNVLAISRHGTFYTAERQGGVTELFSIDTETGDVISIGSNSIANLAALAFKPSRPTNLYAVDGASGGASSLYLLDPEDASVVANLGPTGFDHVVGLAFHPVTGALYGTSSAPFVAGGGTGELLAIDAATGAATAVGMHGTQTPDLAFAPSGLLYSWDEPSNDDLIRIDLTTGAATPVGPCGVETMRSGLAIDRAGNAFLKNASEIYSVDRTTGVCTLSATLSPPGTLHNVLTFDESGVAYSAERIGAGSRIYTADLTSGAVTLIGENDIAKLAALAFRPQPLPALYATDGAGSNPSTLYRLDPRDGSVLQTIGPIGFDHVTGISFDPITGVLYGTQSAGDDGAPASPGQLLRVDLETGAGTAVGGAHGERTPDLAFAPWGILYTWAESGDDLATLDLTTGLTTIVGDCGVSTFRTGLAADLLGNLVVKAGTEVFGVDPGTGLCTPLVSLTAPGRLHNVLEMSPRGTLFSAERIASGTDFYTVDLQTGDTVAMGSNGISDLSAVAYLPEPSSTLGIVSGAIALLVLARLRTRFAS